MDKPRVAFIIPGGLGTGSNNVGIPVLEQIVNRLSATLDITVFQLFPTNPDYQAKRFELISIFSKSPFVKSCRLFCAFHKKHRQKKFSVVHGFWVIPSGFYATLIGKFYRIKSIVSVLGGDAVYLPEINYGQLRNPIYKFLGRWSVHQTNEVIVLTNYLKHSLQKNGINRQFLRVIPWGVDFNLFKYNPRKSSEAIQFLHVANLHPVKDQSTLLKCFKIINDKIEAHLTIIGEGDEKEKVMRLVAELDLDDDVSIVDPMPNSLLPEYYHRANILLHTSLSEGQSEVVTEAMSCGVLVAGTEVGLIFDLPDFTVSTPVKNYLLLAEKILSILNHPEEIDRKVKGAKEWANQHSIEYTVAELLTLYNDALV